MEVCHLAYKNELSLFIFSRSMLQMRKGYQHGYVDRHFHFQCATYVLKVLKTESVQYSILENSMTRFEPLTFSSENYLN